MKYCLTLDLKPDKSSIAEYDKWHQQVWPEIIQSIHQAGITNLEIYRLDSRLFMLMETNENFSFEKKAENDANNAKVQEWETLMWQFQQPLAFAKPGEKWMLMNKIFDLKSYS